MLVRDVIEKLELLSPRFYAEKWDNCGLLAGHMDSAVSKVMLAVDATDDVVRQAVDAKVDMLITHHPLIFGGIMNVNDQSFVGRRLLKLIEHGIALYAMHTNFDIRGMADAAADMLELKDTSVLEVTYQDDKGTEGIGRVGCFDESMSLRECCELVKSTFDVDAVKVFGDLDKEISVVAISPGSGKKMSMQALKEGADVFITGDIDHHEGIDAVASGLCIIDAGHFGIEKLFVPYIKAYVASQMPSVTVLMADEKAPFIII